jgi:hypothetical protein
MLGLSEGLLGEKVTAKKLSPYSVTQRQLADALRVLIRACARSLEPQGKGWQ